MTVHPSAVVEAGLVLGADAHVGAFAVLGVQPDGADLPPTAVGPGATIRAHAVIYAGSRIGARFHLGDGARVREGCQIGDDVSIGARTILEHHVVLEDEVRIHSGAFVPELTVVRRGAWIGPAVVVTNARHPGRPGTKDALEGVELGERCRVGANATLLPGVRIGAGALVGAGAVVTADVPDGALVYGNPARVRGRAPT